MLVFFIKELACSWMKHFYSLRILLFFFIYGKFHAFWNSYHSKIVLNFSYNSKVHIILMSSIVQHESNLSTDTRILNVLYVSNVAYVWEFFCHMCWTSLRMMSSMVMDWTWILYQQFITFIWCVIVLRELRILSLMVMFDWGSK